MFVVERSLFEGRGGGHVRERKWWWERVNLLPAKTIHRLHLRRMNPESALYFEHEMDRPR